MAQRRVTQATAAASTINLVLTPTVAIPSVPSGTAGVRPTRLLRVFLHYWGGTIDATHFKLVVPSQDAGNLTFRRPAGAGTSAAFAAEWDFTNNGITLTYGTAVTVVATINTIADAAAAVPTGFSAIAIWEENA